MGVSIFSNLEAKYKMLLNCDGGHGGLTGSIEEVESDTYASLHTKAVRAGWRFLRDGRILGPCCTRPES